MTDINEVNQILKSIGRRDGLPELALDNHGCTGITLVDGVTLCFEWHQQQQNLHIYTPLPELAHSTEQRDQDYRVLLRFNCLTPGPVITMHPQRDDLYLQLTLAASSLTIESLDKALDQLTAQRKTLISLFSKRADSTAYTRSARHHR